LRDEKRLTAPTLFLRLLFSLRVGVLNRFEISEVVGVISTISIIRVS